MKLAGAALVALGVGFLVGFIWGRDTREALPGATDASFEGGVLTVRVNAGRAAREGLRNLL